MLNSELNRHTQPHTMLPVFANWDVIVRSWYYALPSEQLKKCQVKPLQIGLQRLVLFRGDDGVVCAVDSFCPHMGTDLALGTVVGTHLQCVFHHWKFNGKGDCVEIPCQNEKPKNLKFRGYTVTERHGAVWVFPDLYDVTPFPEFEEYRSIETVAKIGVAYERSCHHHVPMINGIDPQHLRTVHKLSIEMDIKVDQNDDQITYHLRGKVPCGTWSERVARKVFGNDYGYSVSYSGGTIGLLTTLKHVRLFGVGPVLPHLTMIFAYRPTCELKTVVTPIYITGKRRGLLGRLISFALLTSIKLSFFALRDEDGQIYENIRFNPHAFLPIDQPLVRFIAYVNRLKPSAWSKSLPPTVSREMPAKDRGLS